MDIDIKELEAFSCVVEKGSFSRAAEVLFLTQPTVSAHVASLERKLGVKLLVRTTKEIYPSDAGNLLYDYAREILRLRSGAVQAIRALSGEMQGTVMIAASCTPGQYYLPGLIRGFRSVCPDAVFDLRTLENAEVSEAVAARKAEIGLTCHISPLLKCVYAPLAEDRTVVITPNTPEFRNYLSTGLPVQLLHERPFITRESGSAARQETDSLLKELGVDPRTVRTAVEVCSAESVNHMVREGLGIALTSRSACEDHCRFGSILSFDLDGLPRRTLYLVRHKNSILSPIAQAFYDYALSAAKADHPLTDN